MPLICSNGLASIISPLTANLAIAGDAGACTTINNSILELRERLDAIFNFLSGQDDNGVQNRYFNQIVQKTAYNACLLQYDQPAWKIKSLLQHIWSQQAGANLDVTLPTWRRFQHDWGTFNNVYYVEDLADAIRLLSPHHIVNPNLLEGHPPLFRIWRYIKDTPGFGEKTAALFVKAIVDVHTVPAYHDHRFLDGFDAIAANDRVQVPVDIVIQTIFKNLIGNNINFNQINELLFSLNPDVLALHDPALANYTAAQASIWDDLWFWGFVTQRTQGGVRLVEVNAAKFWGLQGAPWEQWDQIQDLANMFVGLLTPIPPLVFAP